jgi:hypothetical protein
MNSMNVFISTRPFTYLIGWSKLNKWYYGVKYAKGTQPNDLWNTYFTSSKYVKQLREDHGEPDVIQIRKAFDDQEKARDWESTVLKRMKVRIDERFLNKTDNKTYSDKPDNFGEITSHVQRDLFENDKEYRDKCKLRGATVGLSNKGKTKPLEQIEKMKAGMAGKHKGKKFCNKDGVTRRVPLEEYNQLLKEGWTPGRCLSSNARQKMRECALNSVLISRQRKA